MSLPVFQGPVKKVMNNLVINIFRFPLCVFSDTLYKEEKALYE